MGNLKHPNVILALLAVVVGIVAIGLYTSGNNQVAGILMVIALGLGVIHWIWSIIDVANTSSLQGSQRVFWLIAVIAIPAVGGTLYYLMHSRRNTIVD